MKILDEIDKRLIKGDNTDALIGAELKLRRNSLSRTLQSVSGGTCSVSYLSKVENNEIKPNPRLLEELCKKVQLKPESVDLIKKGKEIYKEVIEAYFESNESVLNDIYDKCFEMKNYRSKIMKLFYLVYVENVRVAKRIILELERIISSILYSDLVIYAYILAEFYYKTNEKLKAYKIYKKISELEIEYKQIYVLSLEGMIKILKEINSPLYLNYFDTLKNVYIKELYYDRISKLDEDKLWYYLQNGYYGLVLDKINDSNKDYQTLRLIVKGLLNIKEEIDVEPIGFGEMIYLYHFDKTRFIKAFESENLSISSEQYLILKLLYNLHDTTNLYSFLSCEFFPFAISSKNKKLINFSFGLIVEELKLRCKYKKCVEFYDQVKEYSEECEKYC